MEEQPNSRMCFVCGIENPIGLHLAFYTDGEDRCITCLQPKPETRATPVICTEGPSARYWTSQRKFHTPLRSRCMTEYYCTLEKQEVDSVA